MKRYERLLSQGCTGAEKPFESLGYKQALRYIQGQITLEEAIASTQVETRQYAKRQLTWFRRPETARLSSMGDTQIRWLHGFGDSPLIVDECFEYVRSFLSPAATDDRNPKAQ